MSAPTIFIHVNHLWGQGHFVRMAAIANALGKRGAQIVLANGGARVSRLLHENVRLVELPLARAADETYARLVDQSGNDIDPAFRDRRTAATLAAFDRAKADLLITETYPFGRRKLWFELDTLVATAHARGIPVLSSVRDIVTCPPDATGDTKRISATHERLARHFSGVLVHGDPAITQLSDSWPRASEITIPIHDTFYVVDVPPDVAAPKSRKGVIVSVGSGAAGATVLEAALAARPHTVLADEPWHFVTGPAVDAGAFASLAARAGAGITISREINPLYPLIAASTLSIGRGGYNTVMESIVTGTRMVIVPFVRPGEDEQLVRARAFAARGLVTLADHQDISATSLAAAIDRAMRAPEPVREKLFCDGAATSASIILSYAGRG